LKASKYQILQNKQFWDINVGLRRTQFTHSLAVAMYYIQRSVAEIT